MTQTKSFSVFSNLKSETHRKIKGKRKQATKTSFTQFAKSCCGEDHRINCCHNHSHPLIFASYSKQTARAEISTAFSNTRILLRLHR